MTGAAVLNIIDVGGLSGGDPAAVSRAADRSL
jgi:hypothetical protein